MLEEQMSIDSEDSDALLGDPRMGLHKPPQNNSPRNDICDDSTIAPTSTSFLSHKSSKLRLSLSLQKRANQFLTVNSESMPRTDPSPAKKMKIDTGRAKSPTVIRKSFRQEIPDKNHPDNQNISSNNKCANLDHEMSHLSSESSTFSISFTAHVLGTKQADEADAVMGTAFHLCDSNSQQSKQDYIQTWVNNIDENVHDPLEIDMPQQTVDCNSRLELPVKTVTFTTPNKQKPPSASSSTSKQTAITEFFTPEKQVKATEEAILSPPTYSSKTAIQELTVPATKDQKVSNPKSEWASIMSRMRGTAANVISEMNGKTVKEQPEKTIKSCPFYKRIPNTGFAIDAFSYGAIAGVTCYFLSHYHYDHYRGLGKWLNKPLYCSQVTANLVQYKIKLDPNLVRVLPLNESRIIENVEVVLLDANHCPGAVMFLFRFPTGLTILHVGDFRADPCMENWKELNQRPIDHIYLDTTYCDNNYDLPPQREVLDYVRRLVRRHAARQSKLLVVTGTYTIGKEKVFMAAAEELNCSVWAPATKRAILTRLNDPVLSKRLVNDPLKARVHVVNISDVKANNLKKYISGLNGAFDQILAFHPTGWEYDGRTAAAGLDSIRPKTFGNISIYGVPYSEHSGFNEMKRFVTHFKPKKIIPTVNVGTAKQRENMEKMFRTWLARWRFPSISPALFSTYLCLYFSLLCVGNPFKEKSNISSYFCD